MNPLAAQARHPRTSAVTRAAALRWWRAGYEAGRQAAGHEHQALAQWDRLVASFHAQRAADQQAKLDALLLEAIAALAGLLSGARPPPAAAQPDRRRQQRSPPTPAGTSTPNAAGSCANSVTAILSRYKTGIMDIQLVCPGQANEFALL